MQASLIILPFKMIYVSLMFFIDANSSITAAVVVLTGLVGANFVLVMVDKLRLRDPIARGIAAASR